MSQRSSTAVAAILLIVLPGCVFSGPPTKELPTKPENVTEHNVENFVTEYEVVLKRNQLVNRNDLDSVNVDVTSAEVYENDSDGYMVYLRIEYHTRNGNNAGDGRYEAAYFVSETVIRRDVKKSGSDSELDPQNGTSIEKMNLH